MEREREREREHMISIHQRILLHLLTHKPFDLGDMVIAQMEDKLASRLGGSLMPYGCLLYTSPSPRD